MDYCVDRCPFGYFLSLKDNYTCEKCSDMCGSCEGPFEYHCLSCPKPISYLDATGKTIVIEYFYIPEKKTCT